MPTNSSSGENLPTFLTNLVQAGFPSPGEELDTSPLDTNQLLVRNPAATFFMRVTGNSMQDAGIYDGDIVVIDKSLQAQDGDIVVAVLNGAYTLKRLRKKGTLVRLQAENKRFADITMNDGDELTIWGVVTFTLRALRSAH
ncbi:MAG: translesion error-prone DNA polymerase V autoproteolytic subunit [Candidatus Saccharimonadales bacterium]